MLVFVNALSFRADSRLSFLKLLSNHVGHGKARVLSCCDILRRDLFPSNIRVWRPVSGFEVVLELPYYSLRFRLAVYGCLHFLHLREQFTTNRLLEVAASDLGPHQREVLDYLTHLLSEFHVVSH